MCHLIQQAFFTSEVGLQPIILQLTYQRAWRGSLKMPQLGIPLAHYYFLRSLRKRWKVLLVSQMLEDVIIVTFSGGPAEL